MRFSHEKTHLEVFWKVATHIYTNTGQQYAYICYIFSLYFLYSLRVAHAVQHHFSTTTGRVAVVKELIQHSIIHLWS